MDIRTHHTIDRTLCGDPLRLEPGASRVAWTAPPAAAADATGLVHGGFVFGVADYAAMIAVNHPHVVLGAAEVKFLKPLAVGGSVIADARVTSESGRKRIVTVSVSRETEVIFEGTFTCYALDTHVLAKK